MLPLHGRESRIGRKVCRFRTTVWDHPTKQLEKEMIHNSETYLWIWKQIERLLIG